MKKILFVTTIAGFLPQFEMSDVRIMQSLGYEVHYASNFNITIYSFDSGSLKKEGIILHHIDIAKSPKSISNNSKAIKQIKKIIDEENIDIVHCHNPMGGVAARMAAHSSKKKPYVIYTAHGFHFYEGAPLKNRVLYYNAEKFLARYTDRIVTINEEDYNAAMKLPTRQRKSAIRIHSVGVDKDKFRPNPEISDQVREELGIPRDAFHIVTAAELNDNKNQKVVIEAIKNLDRKDIYYSICGVGPNRGKLENLINTYVLSDRIRLLGYRNDMERILQSADCFAFPSQREGLGIAAVEALLSGIPVIAADNRGTREYVKDGINGIMCRATSVADFKNAIDKLASDSIMKQKMASNSRESVRDFTIEEVAKVMRCLYEEADAVVSKRQV